MVDVDDAALLAEYKAFHEELKVVCLSLPQFDKSIQIDVSHLRKKIWDDLRNAIRKEHIASVIMGGNLLLESCEKKSDLRKITIIAKLDSLSWLSMSQRKIEFREGVAIRIGIKELPVGMKHVVVTVFRDKKQERENHKIPEVKSEIW